MGITDHAFILKLNTDFLLRTSTKTKLIPGAIELLEYLKPFYRLFILSNGFREIQSLKLQHAGLASYFEKIILSEDAHIQKPHKEIFDYALRNTNARRNESLLIGDCYEADIEGAFHAHIDQIWYNPDDLPCKTITPTYQVHTLEEIQHIL
jgi:putative hydrolase of the HAD superfamily